MIRTCRHDQLYTLLCKRLDRTDLVPGDIVRNRFWAKSFGIIVAVIESDVTVMWSIDPYTFFDSLADFVHDTMVSLP